MAKPQRKHQAGTFFITTNCWNRRRLFQVDANAQLLLDIISKYREHYGLHAYVIMPDHIHLLITPTDITLERAMQFIKGGFSHAYGLTSNAKSEIWHRGFTDHRIRDSDDFDKHLAYLHNNPVAAGLSAKPEDFPWSSASKTVPMDTCLSG
jgi:putative transposase